MAIFFNLKKKGFSKTDEAFERENIKPIKQVLLKKRNEKDLRELKVTGNKFH